ncbi:glycoside hydrolase [Lindgomyces ingoldianus]|uniref:Glycoside hydrolase n=1 Tax=Lindgomyces ingoldianus TaxID=673940 RepID=A0ACB6QLH7_9PLEO|nr:glycoside hydrolase [Lindgomyces ingoldianus]KAF2467745.1 glycoside hydrolase [Lindgomyces ingoldianus]
MYRISDSGIKNKAGVGQGPTTMVKFIQEVRDNLKGTPLSKIPVGHVDTWSAWGNKSNKAVIDEVDFVGTNLFPYYEDDKGNAISNATAVFNYALNSTKSAAGKKPIWITETGWPLTGPDFGQAKASLDNAREFWNTIGCTLFGRTNVWWYELHDSNPDNAAKFGITKDLSTTPQFNLTCSANSGAPASINNKPTSVGNISTVTLVNSLVVGLSMLFAVAAWAV